MGRGKEIENESERYEAEQSEECFEARCQVLPSDVLAFGVRAHGFLLRSCVS